MPYAEGRTYYDADSHLMELGDWLVQYADPDVRDHIRPLALGGAGRLAEEAVRAAEVRRNDLDSAAELEADVMEAKGWSALGAFDPAERSRALDLLGFDSQLVFSTFAGTQFHVRRPRSPVRRHARAQPGDGRVLPGRPAARSRWVSSPLHDPELARQATEEAIAMGCGAVLVPSVPPPSKSPTHPDYWPVWAAARRRRRPVHAAHRRRRPSAASRLPRERQAAGDRLPRRGREHPLQGLHGAVPPTRDLPRVHGARRHLRTVPRAARRLHRAGRDVGGRH